MVAEQYERVIKLAQRAMELERELAAVKQQLASEGVPAPTDDLPASEHGQTSLDDDDLSASLSRQVLAFYKTHSSRALTSEQVAKSLGITDSDRINMLRSYAVRFSKGPKPKLRKIKRGHYQFIGK